MGGTLWLREWPCTSVTQGTCRNCLKMLALLWISPPPEQRQSLSVGCMISYISSAFFSLDPCFPGVLRCTCYQFVTPQILTPHEDGPHFGMVAPTFANVRHGWPSMEVALGILKWHGEWKIKSQCLGDTFTSFHTISDFKLFLIWGFLLKSHFQVRSSQIFIRKASKKRIFHIAKFPGRLPAASRPPGRPLLRGYVLAQHR